MSVFGEQLDNLFDGSISDLIDEVNQDAEWLETTTGDEVKCISLENLEGIINRIFNIDIKF